MLTTLQNFSIYFWPTLHNTSYIFYTYHLYPRPTALSLSHKTRCLSQFPYTLPFSPLLYRLAAKEIKSPAECYHVVSYPRTNDLSTKCYKCIYRQPLHGGRNVKLRYFAFGAVSIDDRPKWLFLHTSHKERSLQTFSLSHMENNNPSSPITFCTKRYLRCFKVPQWDTARGKNQDECGIIVDFYWSLIVSLMS